MENDEQAAQQPVAEGGERGAKSPYLNRAEGGVLDDSPGYLAATEGAPEQGIFKIVGGYMDPDGVIHNEVHLRATSGHEEDLLGNDAIPFFRRMTGILSQCTLRIGTITDKPMIIQAIRGLPAGSRQHLLVCLRRTSHWRATKDIYSMHIDCPKCEKESAFNVNLGELDLYEMPDPKKRTFSGVLPASRLEYTWAITRFEQDEILWAINQDEKIQNELLTWSILIRLKSLGGEPVDIKPEEVVDVSTGKLMKNAAARAAALRQTVKNLSSDDRQYLRDEFMEHEPGIESEIEIECPKCKKEFVGRLDLSQRDFFFPSATRKSSKRRSFT